MANFGHGGNIKEISRSRGMDFKDIIDFSANINPLGISEGLKEAVIESFNEIEKYPDITYLELKKAIAEYENKRLNKDDFLDYNDIVLGNGAAEVLFNLARALNPHNALILGPTFSEYEEAVNAVDSSIIIHKLKEDDDFAIKEDILDLLDERIDLIFICNPNNPTGQITSKELLGKILKRSKEKDITVIIDESFLDFVEEDYSMIPYINIYDNLIIVKSLTKFFAIPGLRIGYSIMRNINFKEKVNKVSPAWNINILAEIATKRVLSDEKYILNTINFMEKERDYLYNELRCLNRIKVFKPSVNFIFFKLEEDIDLRNELLARNILIRSCDNYHGLNENYYRVAVRSHDENIKLITALKNIIN